MLLLSTPGGSPALQPHPSGAVGDTLRPPVSAGEAFRRGAERLSAGDARGAADDFERALALGYRPAAEAHLRLGLARRHLPLHAFRAIRAFRAALREDPASLEARYGLADTYLALDGWEAQREARGALIEILERDPFFRDAHARWQALYLDEDENARVAAAFARLLGADFREALAARTADLLLQIEARQELHDLLARWRAAVPGTSVRRDYYEARLEFLAGAAAAGTRAWLRGLAAVRSAEELEPFWSDVLPLLAQQEADLRRTLPAADQAAFLREFWELRDPLPFSDSNERLAEQYRRIAEARRRYLWKKPLAKESVLGDFVDDLGRPSFDTRLEGRSLDDRGTLYLRHGEPDRRFVEVGGAEFWRYLRPGSPGGRLQFHFKLMDGPMARGNDTVYSMLPTTDVGAGHVRSGHAGAEAVENTVAGLTTDTYGFDYGPRVFPVATAAATFRNPADRWRTDVVLAYAVPLDSLRALGAPATADFVGRLKLYGGRSPRELESRAAGVLASGAQDPFVRAFELTPDEGARAYVLQVDAPAAGALGQARGELHVPSYGAAGLQLSDVLLARAVAPAGELPGGITRGGLDIEPFHPSAVTGAAPLHLYYELYDPGAAAEDGRVRYQVEYRVRSERVVNPGLLRRIFGGARGAAREEADQVALSFAREVRGPAERVAETISLDLRMLPPGRYGLTVSVRDLTTQREVERATELEIVGGAT